MAKANFLYLDKNVPVQEYSQLVQMGDQGVQPKVFVSSSINFICSLAINIDENALSGNDRNRIQLSYQNREIILQKLFSYKSVFYLLLNARLREDSAA